MRARSAPCHIITATASSSSDSESGDPSLALVSAVGGEHLYPWRLALGSWSRCKVALKVPLEYALVSMPASPGAGCRTRGSVPRLPQSPGPIGAILYILNCICVHCLLYALIFPLSITCTHVFVYSSLACARKVSLCKASLLAQIVFLVQINDGLTCSVTPPRSLSRRGTQGCSRKVHAARPKDVNLSQHFAFTGPSTRNSK
jgi:hypothetical protein